MRCRSRRVSSVGISAQLGASNFAATSAIPLEPAPLPLAVDFPDRHSLLLTQACSEWFVPALEVAKRLGFSTTKALSCWATSLAGAEATFGAHFSDYGKEKFWLLGPHQHPTVKSLAIPFTCDEQRKVVALLESEPLAMRYGLFGCVDTNDEDIATWERLYQTLKGSAVFYLDDKRAQKEQQGSRVHERHLRFHFISRLQLMIKEGIVKLGLTPASSSLPSSTSPPLAASDSKRDSRPASSHSSAAAPEFDFHDRTTNTAGQAPYSAVTRILYIVMRESGVSNAQAPHLITSILCLLGFVLTSAAPSATFAAELVKEGGIHALAQMGLQIREWGEAGERLTVCIDAASIGEEKYEGLALVKCTDNGLPCADSSPDSRNVLVLGGSIKLKRGRGNGVTFTRLGTGLTELSSGTDECKFVALRENMNDIINCHNAVLADDYGKPMTEYDYVKPMSSTVNDHAETVRQVVTSDSIERYFGRASWLRNSASGQNMTKTNVNHTLNIIETKVGSRLVQAYLREPEVVAKMMTRAMKYKAEYEDELKIRRGRNLDEKILAYKEADKERKRKLAVKANNVRLMVKEAAEWTHLPLLSARRSGQDPSITGTAAEIFGKRGGTEKQNNAAVQQWAVRWLTVFETVFDLDEVPELKHVFYGASGRASIQAGRTQEDLMQNLADCSEYMSARADHFAAHLDRVSKEGEQVEGEDVPQAGEATDASDQRAEVPGQVAPGCVDAAQTPR